MPQTLVELLDASLQRSLNVQTTLEMNEFDSALGSIRLHLDMITPVVPVAMEFFRALGYRTNQGSTYFFTAKKDGKEYWVSLNGRTLRVEENPIRENTEPNSRRFDYRATPKK